MAATESTRKACQFDVASGQWGQSVCVWGGLGEGSIFKRSQKLSFRAFQAEGAV